MVLFPCHGVGTSVETNGAGPDSFPRTERVFRDLEGGTCRVGKTVVCNRGCGGKVVVGCRGAIGREIIVKKRSFSLQLFGELGLDGR